MNSIIVALVVGVAGYYFLTPRPATPRQTDISPQMPTDISPQAPGGSAVYVQPGLQQLLLGYAPPLNTAGYGWVNI